MLLWERNITNPRPNCEEKVLTQTIYFHFVEEEFFLTIKYVVLIEAQTRKLKEERKFLCCSFKNILCQSCSCQIYRNPMLFVPPSLVEPKNNPFFLFITH